MTAGGVKQLRLCPFCGAGGDPVLNVTCGAAFVRCAVCMCSGPTVQIYHYLPISQNDLSDAEDITDAWDDAIAKAKNDAAHGWNLRAWEGNFWPEDLERMEEKMEQEADV